MIYTDKIHLTADSIQELHEFAQKIGLNKCWFENKRNKFHPHYDLVNSNYVPLKDKQGKQFIQKTIENGAIEVEPRGYLWIINTLYRT